MGPKEKIERLAQTAEDRILLSRVWERLSAGQRRNIPATSCFLSPREQELVRRLIGEKDLTFFWRLSGSGAGGCLLSSLLLGGELGR